MKPYTNQQIQLGKGDSLYLMSDGYIDQFGGPNGKKFMNRALKELLVKNSQDSMKNQGREIETALENWMNGFEKNYKQVDDITILGVCL